MLRKRNDAAGPKKGELGKYIEPSGVKPGDDWGDTSNIGTNARGHGKYTDDVAPVRNKQPYEAGEGSYSIADELENQSSDSGNRKIRSRGQP
jgi:hypothetical protein